MMLAEEKALRKWSIYINGEKNIDRYFREIRALIRAVREDCANMAEDIEIRRHSGGTSADPLCPIAAAIRGRK